MSFFFKGRGGLGTAVIFGGLSIFIGKYALPLRQENEENFLVQDCKIMFFFQLWKR